MNGTRSMRVPFAFIPYQMKQLRGGRSVGVTVDNGAQGHVGDWYINTAIFEAVLKDPSCRTRETPVIGNKRPSTLFSQRAIV